MDELPADAPRPDQDLGSLLREDPTRVFSGVPNPLAPDSPAIADTWQAELLRGHFENPREKWLVCCGRQSGKSLTAAGLALVTALTATEDNVNVLIVSRSLRQSAEVLRACRMLYWGLKGERLRDRVGQRVGSIGHGSSKRKGLWVPGGLSKWLRKEGYDNQIEESRLGALACQDVATKDNVLTMEFTNGSRIISLPCKPDTTVGFSAVRLLILDEAARLPDGTYQFLSATRAVVRGAVFCLSTPFGKRGDFYKLWSDCDKAQAQGKPEPWKRVKVTAPEIPRINKDWLEQERADIGEHMYLQEYECHFRDAIDSYFSSDAVAAAVKGNYEPLAW